MPVFVFGTNPGTKAGGAMVGYVKIAKIPRTMLVPFSPAAKS